MSGFLYKPIGQGQIGGGRANFLIENTGFVSGGWYDKEGNLIERFERFQGTPEPGQRPGVKFTARKPGGAYGEDLVARFTDKNGKVWEYNIPNGGQRYEGADDDPSTLHPVNKGPMGGGSSGVPGQFGPGQIGDYGATPAYIGGMFPSPVLAQYTPIKAANYNFVDPFKFAEKYGSFARDEVSKNFTQAQDMALQSLDTELKGLQSFVPAASALKRQEISVDNQFNQAQRTQQINQVLPEATGDLAGQRERALAYASGRIPDEVADKGLEIGLRSQAADRAMAGGFGASSSVSRKASDLLSAEARVKLSQYGDQLLSGNINQKAGLFLAPTEYLNAGSQISVNPSQSTSQLAAGYTGALNAMAGLPTAQAFQSQIGQEQYSTGLKQRTNEFNAGNKLQLSEFNAGTQNSFALSQFGYNAGYANSVAGAAQTNINTQFGIDQQNLYNQLLQQYMAQSQNAGMLNAIFQGGLGLLGAGGFGGLTNFGSGAKAGLTGLQGPQPTKAGESGMSLGSGISDVISGAGDVLGHLNPF